MSKHPANNEHRPRKRFGQNFLHDSAVIERIIQAIAPRAEQTLVEIGPGQGALSEHLIGRCQHLHLIEIDRDLAAQLQAQYAAHPNLSLHLCDALDFDFSSLGHSLRLIGNLPYNISTPLLIHLLDYYPQLDDAHFMLQKEVVERICATPGNKNYGRLSVVLQYYFQPEYLFKVSPQAFYPVPKVDSAILRLRKLQRELSASDERSFRTLCKTAFAQRRKTLRNNLKNLFPKDTVNRLESAFDLNRRPETFSVEEFIALHNTIYCD